jgi:transcriptional regulator with XRE-family HTH domain
LGITQDKLAYASGVKQSLISQLENRAELTLVTAGKLGQVFGIAPKELQLEHNLTLLFKLLEEGEISLRKAKDKSQEYEDYLWDNEWSVSQFQKFLDALGRLKVIVWMEKQHAMKPESLLEYELGAQDVLESIVTRLLYKNVTADRRKIYLFWYAKVNAMHNGFRSKRFNAA